MSLVNHTKKEVNCKIVFYGPGLGGKTTNIQHIYKKTSKENKSSFLNLDTDNERTLFFDFLPLDLGEIRGYKTRFHLYTVPGQVFYEASRKLVLRAVDGVVFVADSQVEKMEANLDSFESLRKNLLEEEGKDIENFPLVMQWNKRDLPNVMSVEDMETSLNKYDAPAFSASAINGDGVFESLKMISKLILMNLRTGL